MSNQGAKMCMLTGRAMIEEGMNQFLMAAQVADDMDVVGHATMAACDASDLIKHAVAMALNAIANPDKDAKPRGE